MNIAGIVDTALEVPIVPSFTRIGYAVRSRTEAWRPLEDYDLTGRVIVMTGATSGLGRAAAERFASMGATLVINGRDADKNEGIVAELIEASGNTSISQIAADLGDYEQVRSLAETVLERHDRVDVLIHNAGALSAERNDAPDGTEVTVASQVVGPFLLTGLLLDRLTMSAPSRVLTMSSGGMYSSGLRVAGLQMSHDDYKGTEQYARAKRAQVSLTEEWAKRFGHTGVRFHTLHPGWADTPGVERALPTFGKILGPLLRTPDQGADTLVWLGADDAALESNGEFWLDRRPRSTHKLLTTSRTDTPARRRELWDWVAQTAGHTP